jgi:hypothetical protein
MEMDIKNRNNAGPIVQIFPERRKISVIGFICGMSVIPKITPPKINRNTMANRTLSPLLTLVYRPPLKPSRFSMSSSIQLS